jgi:hypothetical protein
MPRGNGMGPMGQGPMTGRGMGWCRGASNAIGMPPKLPGSGLGWDGGRGGGWRHRYRGNATGLPGWQRAQAGGHRFGASVPGSFPPAFSKEEELASLRLQVSNLGQALGALKARIEVLDKPEADATSSTE